MKFAKYIFVVLTLVCIAFIWYNSSKSGPESSELSQGLLLSITDFLRDIGVSSELSEFFLRKIAHFLEYSGLGFLLTCDLYFNFKSPAKHISLSLGLGLITACIDETIQIFSEGRSSKITDVWIDFSGIVAATIVTMILIFLIFRIGPLGNKR